MRWWVLILLPFHLLAQETYDDCVSIPHQSYQVNYDADKNYYWSISSGEVVSTSSNTITIQWPDSAGDYLISVYTTRFGCDGDTSEYQVSITPCPYATLFFPSSFTPNGDGINEQYNVGGRSVDDIEYIAIYNRWGQKVFESAGYVSEWDGTINNKKLPIGTYYYLIDLGPNQKKHTGPITIMR